MAREARLSLVLHASIVGLAVLFLLTPTAAVAADSDSDGIEDGADNCPSDPNPGQEDEDSDGVGDPCDPCPSKQRGTESIQNLRIPRLTGPISGGRSEPVRTLRGSAENTLRPGTIST